MFVSISPTCDVQIAAMPTPKVECNASPRSRVVGVAMGDNGTALHPGTRLASSANTSGVVSISSAAASTPVSSRIGANASNPSGGSAEGAPLKPDGGDGAPCTSQHSRKNGPLTRPISSARFAAVNSPGPWKDWECSAIHASMAGFRLGGGAAALTACCPVTVQRTRLRRVAWMLHSNCTVHLCDIRVNSRG